MDFMSGISSIFGGGEGGFSDPTASATGRSLFEPSGQSQAGAFDPFGFAGRVMGLPTTSERMGGVRQEALQHLAELTADGTPPEQALVKFLQDPRGQKWFATDPDLVNTLNAFKTSITPPTPQLHSGAPGSDMYAATPGQVKKVGSTPLTPAQAAPRNPQALHNVPRAGGGVDVLDPNRIDPATGLPALVHSTPSIVDLAPGHLALDPKTNQIVRNNPTTGQQDFLFYGDLSGAPSSRLRELAELKLVPESQQPGVKERALNGLVRNRIITPEIRDKIMADIYQVKEVKNSHGEGTGQYGIFDLTANVPGGAQVAVPGSASGAYGGAQVLSRPGANSQAMPVPQSGEFQNYRGGPNGQPNTAGNSTVPFGGTGTNFENQPGPHTRGPTNLLEQSKNKMFLSSGLSAQSLRATGDMFGTLNPAWQTKESREANEQAAAVRNLHAQINRLAADTGTMGVPKQILADWKSLAPQLGWFTSPPGDAVQRGIMLHDAIVQQQELMKSVIRNEEGIYSHKQTKDAATSHLLLEGVRQALPSRQAMVALDEAILAGKEGVTAAGAAGNIARQVGNVLSGERPDATPARTMTPADVQKLSLDQIRTLDTRSLPPESRTALRQRLQELRGAPNGAGGTQTPARSNFAAESPENGSDLGSFVRNPGAAARRAMSPDQIVNESFNVLFDAMQAGKVSQDAKELRGGRLQESDYSRRARRAQTRR